MDKISTRPAARAAITLICTNCGEQFERKTKHIYEHNFCDANCKQQWLYNHGRIGKQLQKSEQSTTVHCLNCGIPFETMKPWIAKFCSTKCAKAYRYSQRYIEMIPEDKLNCYLREAHAILANKNWRGKNKCVHLPETCE
jgi:endogenous inhibitor of DNA gyrase (YacG/DUF329 family)